jgi:hypothetical protein
LQNPPRTRKAFDFVLEDYKKDDEEFNKLRLKVGEMCITADSHGCLSSSNMAPDGHHDRKMKSIDIKFIILTRCENLKKSSHANVVNLASVGMIKNVIMTEWVDLPRHEFFALFFWFLFSITILGKTGCSSR